MPKHRNVDWALAETDEGALQNWDMVSIAVLMDIRKELQHLNSIFDCTNFLSIPAKLDRIGRNTTAAKKRRRRKYGWKQA